MQGIETTAADVQDGFLFEFDGSLYARITSNSSFLVCDKIAEIDPTSHNYSLPNGGVTSGHLIDVGATVQVINSEKP
jgi:hypothetical protein